MTGALAASIGANPQLVEVEVMQVDGGHLWHRRVRLAGGWWRPEGCERPIASRVIRRRAEPPGSANVCAACWPVWPALKR